MSSRCALYLTLETLGLYDALTVTLPGGAYPPTLDPPSCSSLALSITHPSSTWWVQAYDCLASRLSRRPDRSSQLDNMEAGSHNTVKHFSRCVEIQEVCLQHATVCGRSQRQAARVAYLVGPFYVLCMHNNASMVALVVTQ